MRAFSIFMALQLLFAESAHQRTHTHAPAAPAAAKHSTGTAAHTGHGGHGGARNPQPAAPDKDGTQTPGTSCLDNCCTAPGAIASAFFTARHILFAAAHRVAAFAFRSVQIATIVAYFQPPAHAPPLI